MRRLILLALALLLQTAAARADDITVYAANAVLADMARRLAGDAATVVMPVPPGTDPALWEPTLDDIAALQAADLIILNGLDYEAWASHVTLPRARTVDTTRGMTSEVILRSGEAHSHGGEASHVHDRVAPVVWLDFRLAQHQAEAIAAALTPLVPEAAANLPALTADLVALDSAARAVGTALDGQAVLAAGPGFEYLARAYGIDLHEVTPDPAAAPSGDEAAALDAALRETGARLMLWPFPPSAPVATELGAEGITPVVFPNAAATPEGRSALDALAASLAAFLKDVK